jgi:dTDP-glucose 4,6-dehydratase
MSSFARTVLITGGAGFIGSHLVRLMVRKYPQYRILNLDALTYAGNLANLQDVETAPNYTFIKADIVDTGRMEALFAEYRIDAVIHLAAESHVDRSILDPLAFVRTNVLGTVSLLNAARKAWKDRAPSEVLFYHVSTDEVYGSLGDTGFFLETTPYDPRSPYSASKASSDHFVRAYGHTYHLPTVISNCSNNYGPYQFPEKLIPLMIMKAQRGEPLPVYGKGENIRDWLWVEDHCTAIDAIFHHTLQHGATGDTFNIGGHNEWKNLDVVHLLCRLMDEKLGRAAGTTAGQITFIKDRPGHDLRYAIDSHKLQRELGWTPSLQFEEGLARTIDWYLANPAWTENVTSGAYQHYFEQQYVARLA